VLFRSLRVEHRLRVFENGVLIRIFGSRRDEVTGDWRELHNEDEMTGSSSHDWILLAFRLQPLLITLNHNAIAIPHTLQLLHTLSFL
jgi:hypothetical protein